MSSQYWVRGEFAQTPAVAHGIPAAFPQGLPPKRALAKAGSKSGLQFSTSVVSSSDSFTKMDLRAVNGDVEFSGSNYGEHQQQGTVQ